MILLKNTFTIILMSLLGISVFFVLSIFLKPIPTIIGSILISLTSIILILFIIIKLIKSKHRNTSAAITKIAILCIVSFSTIVISSFNYVLNDVYKKEFNNTLLNPFQKIESYKRLISMVSMDGLPKEVNLEEWNQNTVDNITFYNKGSGSETINKEILTIIRQKQPEFNHLFGDVNEKPLKIVLYDNTNEMLNNKKMIKEWNVQGFYKPLDKSIHVLLPSNAEMKESFKETIIHEYTHYLLSIYLEELDLSYYHIPIWFNEGIAEYVEKQQKGIPINDISKLEYAELSKINNISQWNDYLRDPYDPYFQSRSFISQLIRFKGTTIIQDIIQNSMNQSFRQSFKDIMNQSISSFDKKVTSRLIEIPDMLKTARIQRYQENDLTKSLETLKDIQAIEPNIVEVNRELSSIYRKLKNYKKAVNYGNKVIMLEPNNSEGYLQLSLIMIFVDIDKAVEISKNSIVKSNDTNVKWYKQFNKLLIDIQKGKIQGDPFSGYLELLTSEYISSKEYKIDLIDKILNEYPTEHSKQKEEIITLKKKLENE
ncbi:tetratricopeptide repeat protein [Guptibacillus hwajinpoensis]|uniref:Tetratricopeptide (TPR) repeat protein n=1 Tax=Guptibacillus hwajinpoensis TaxID=208199 RepID=A0ABU0K242_9BACL|nr:collagenase [Alkalihalobacillus hemicentroti]MDQ0482483.1 tetratricopeptide (TPR) repeat protein [Alkalihalobacillus hemicentroti]